MEWDRPSRADHYIMRHGARMESLFHKADDDDFRVVFKDRLPKFKPEELPPGIRIMTKDEIAKVHRHWRREEAARVACQIEERNSNKR